ncbi:MAG TPA: cysteine dioxygenase family protein [Stellaceae bacterium]|nr:cysteine dioxygenase family protein [Stellaceae bacterium]
MVPELQPAPYQTRTVRRQDPVPALAATIAAIARAHRDDESALCVWVAGALTGAIRDPDWIPFGLRQPSPTGYRRERLYEAPDGSFSIGCFVWAPGQRTPIHDHRGWGVVGVAFGTLESVSFFRTEAGRLVPSVTDFIPAGSCDWAHPAGGDIHRIGAAGGETAISIHVYGTRFDSVCRHRYLPDGTILTQ